MKWPTLVPYWKRWHKMHSVRWGGGTGLLAVLVAAAIKASMGAAFIGMFSFPITLAIVGAIFLASTVGALIDQPVLRAPEKPKDNAGMTTK